MRGIRQTQNPEEECRKEMSKVNSPSRNIPSNAEHNDPSHNTHPNTCPYCHDTASVETEDVDILPAGVIKPCPLVLDTRPPPPPISPNTPFLPSPPVLETRPPPPPISPKKPFLPSPSVIDTSPPPPPVSPKKPFLPRHPVLDTRPPPPPIFPKKTFLHKPPHALTPPPPISPKKMFLPSPPVLDTRTPTPKPRKKYFLHRPPVQDNITPPPPESPKTTFLPSTPVLDTRSSPSVLPERESKPPLCLTWTSPPTPSKPISRRQGAFSWEEVVGEGPGCELRPAGPGDQNEDVFLSSQDSLFMNSVITKSQCQFVQPLLDLPLPYTSQGSEAAQKMVQSGSVAEQNPFEPRGKVLGSPTKASKPEEKGLMEAKLFTKPPGRNTLLSPGPGGRSNNSPNGCTSPGPETRAILSDLQPLLLPGLCLLTPIVDKENSEVDSVSSEGDEDPMRRKGDTEEVGVQDTKLRSKSPNIKTRAEKVTKSARKMIDRWKEKMKRGTEDETKTERKKQPVNLQHSLGLQSQMKAIEEEENSKYEEDSDEEDSDEENDEEKSDKTDQAGEEFSSVICAQQQPMNEQPSHAEPLRRKRFMSSFKINFSPVSLMEEILTGEEWAPFLSPNTSPSPSPSIDQSKSASQRGFDDDSQIKNEPVLGSTNDAEQNHMDTDIPVYEEVILNQSDPNKTEEKQSDDRQKKVKNCNDNRFKTVIESEMLLDNEAAGWSLLDQFRAISSNECNNSGESVRNQPLDLSCVKSHKVLDSFAQKHRIELNKKRKHRVPKLKKGFFRIGRTNIRAPDIQLIKQPSPSNPSSAGPPPCDIFPNSVFYSIPPFVEHLD